MGKREEQIMMQKALFKQFGKQLKGISEDDFTEEDD